MHCSPIEPWDEAYLKEHKIKHMSFHSFMRKMTSGVDRGKFLAMDDISCSIKVGKKQFLYKYFTTTLIFYLP